MLKIRRPLGRLIFNMGIAIPGKTVFLIERAPWALTNYSWVHKYFKPLEIPFYANLRLMIHKFAHVIVAQPS